MEASEELQAAAHRSSGEDRPTHGGVARELHPWWCSKRTSWSWMRSSGGEDTKVAQDRRAASEETSTMRGTPSRLPYLLALHAACELGPAQRKWISGRSIPNPNESEKAGTRAHSPFNCRRHMGVRRPLIGKRARWESIEIFRHHLCHRHIELAHGVLCPPNTARHTAPAVAPAPALLPPKEEHFPIVGICL